MVLAIFGGIGILASIIGVYFSLRRLFRAFWADKKFRTLLNSHPELKSRLRDLRLQARQEESRAKMGEVIDSLVELSKQLPSEIDRQAMLDILLNNTYQGQLNYTKEVLSYEKTKS